MASITASPGTLASDSTGSGGFVAWTNPSNAASSNDVRATAFVSGANKPTHYLKATNFDFSAIPAGATIDGIIVSIEKADVGGLAFSRDERVRLIKSDASVSTTDKADTATNYGATDAVVNYGSSSDLWGETWTDTDIKDTDFGIAFSATTNSGGKTGSQAGIDHIQITVHYTEAVTNRSINVSDSVTVTEDKRVFIPTKVRQVYYNESSTVSSSAATTDQNKVDITFTPDASATYFIMASAIIGNNSVTSDVRAKLHNVVGSGTVFNSVNVEPKDTTNYISFAGLGVETFGLVPDPQAYQLSFSTEGSTARIKEATIMAIRKESLDEYSEAIARTANSTLVYADKINHAITPPTDGDYIIIAAADVDAGSTAQTVAVQLSIDGTPWGSALVPTEDTTNFRTYATIVKRNLTASPHNIILQYARGNPSSGAAVGIKNARIIILRADTFENVYYGEDSTATTNNTTAFVNEASVSQLMIPVEHLVFGCALVYHASSTRSVIYRMTDNIRTIEGLQEFGISSLAPFFSFWKKTYLAASFPFRIQFRAEVAGDNATMDESAIVVMQIDNSPDRNIDTSETVTATDTPDVLRAASRNITVSDSVTLQEDAIAIERFGSGGAPTPQVSDTVTVTDTPNIQVVVSAVITINVSDTATLTDTASLYMGVGVSTSDTVTIEEDVDIDIDLLLQQPNNSDTATVSESVTVFIPFLTIGKSESITVGESKNVLIASATDTQIVANDTAEVTDTPTVVIGNHNVNVSDSITVSEVRTVMLVNKFVDTSDSITTSEETVARLLSFISSSESITVAESVDTTRDESRDITVLDSVTTTEDSTVLLVSHISVSDSASLTESTSLFVQVGTYVKNAPLYLRVSSDLSLMLGPQKMAYWDDDGRPANPIRGQVGFNTTTNRIDVWNGTAWKEYAPV